VIGPHRRDRQGVIGPHRRDRQGVIGPHRRDRQGHRIVNGSDKYRLNSYKIVAKLKTIVYY